MPRPLFAVALIVSAPAPAWTNNGGHQESNRHDGFSASDWLAAKPKIAPIKTRKITPPMKTQRLKIKNLTRILCKLRAVGCGLGLALAFNTTSHAAVICSGSPVSSTVVASTSSIAEGGGTAAQFVFTLGGPVGNDTHLTLQISGTASNGVDFQTLATQITIPSLQTTATLTLTPIPDAVTEGTETVTVTITASDNACVYLGSPNAATISIVEVANSGLATALDGPNLAWVTGGDAAWSELSTSTHDGVDAAESGFIFDSQESWLETSVNGPGTLTFWWKVSSEPDFDWLRFHIDGVLQQQISGEVNWQQRSFQLPQGSHTLRWRYVKDSNGAFGQDRAWLDQVSFTPASGVPLIVAQPASQIAWAGANVTLNAVALGAAPLKQQWYFSATNAIAGATNAWLVLNDILAAQAGQYRLVVSNTLGSATSSIAAVTFTNYSPVAQILLFSDSLTASPFESALANLGQTFQGFSDEPTFNAAVNTADRPSTLIIVDAPQWSYAFSSLAGFVSGGGRVLIQAYSFAGSPTLAATFQVAVESRSSTPLPLYDWGGSPLFAGLSSPLGFTEINLDEDVQRLHPLNGARSVAGFSGGPVPGEAGVVIGNGGRTIVNGFYVEGATSGTDAVQLAQNEITFLFGTVVPPALVISDIHHSANGQFGFSVEGAVGQAVVIETSPDLQTWTELQTNTLGSGPLPFTDPQPASLPSRFYRLRSP